MNLYKRIDLVEHRKRMVSKRIKRMQRRITRPLLLDKKGKYPGSTLREIMKKQTRLALAENGSGLL